VTKYRQRAIIRAVWQHPYLFARKQFARAKRCARRLLCDGNGVITFSSVNRRIYGSGVYLAAANMAYHDAAAGGKRRREGGGGMRRRMPLKA